MGGNCAHWGQAAGSSKNSRISAGSREARGGHLGSMNKSSGMEISDISEETQVTEGGCGLRYMSKNMLEMSLER